jgi:two-component system repressor protein LuxO
MTPPTLSDSADHDEAACEMDDRPSVVYLVEGDAALRQLLTTQLASSHCEVVELRGGREFLRHYDPTRNHVILLDVCLSDIDGMDLIRRLARQSPKPPILVITADAAVATAVETFRLGVFDYLSKPLDARRLVRQVMLALEDYRARRPMPPDAGPHMGEGI